MSPDLIFLKQCSANSIVEYMILSMCGFEECIDNWRLIIIE